MSEIAYRLVTPHRDDCSALRHVADGTWGSPWFICGALSRRAKDGTRRGTLYLFLDAICNTPDCPGKMIVSHDWLCEQLPHTGKLA